MDKMLENYGHNVIAELYDYFETDTEDIELIRDLIKDKHKLNILECFCGTGRILIPLALDGHNITGIDLSTSMLDRARNKISKLDARIKDRITLLEADVINLDWGKDYDLIVLGGNAFYELSFANMQEKCIEKAFKALKNNGLLFIDNNDYKGNWGECDFSKEIITFEGKCENGCYGKLIRKDNRFDSESNILYFERRLHIIEDNKETILEYDGQKHPVTKEEVEQWLNKYNLTIDKLLGDRDGSEYASDSSKAIFLARKTID